jgi:hypothetical protein
MALSDPQRNGQPVALVGSPGVDHGLHVLCQVDAPQSDALERLNVTLSATETAQGCRVELQAASLEDAWEHLATSPDPELIATAGTGLIVPFFFLFFFFVSFSFEFLILQAAWWFARPSLRILSSILPIVSWFSHRTAHMLFPFNSTGSLPPASQYALMPIPLLTSRFLQFVPPRASPWCMWSETAPITR